MPGSFSVITSQVTHYIFSQFTLRSQYVRTYIFSPVTLFHLPVLFTVFAVECLFILSREWNNPPLQRDSPRCRTKLITWKRLHLWSLQNITHSRSQAVSKNLTDKSHRPISPPVKKPTKTKVPETKCSLYKKFPKNNLPPVTNFPLL